MGATADLLVRVSGDTRDVESKLGRVGGALGGIAGVARKGGIALGVAVAAGATKAVLSFAEVDKGMREVFTLMPGISQDAMSKMTDDVIGLSTKMGVATDQVIPSLYQAISAGVPPDSVFSFMETATKASIGGVTDLETAVDGITSVVNAFGRENIDAAQASDLMFTAVRLGKTDMGQLSKSLFQVNPIASALGVQFGDVAASLAVLTAQGVPTSVAATQVKSALAELGKTGTVASDAFAEITGTSFKDFIAGGGDMKQAFDLMRGGADDMGVEVVDLFGSIEAGSAVMALTSTTGASAFGDAMTAMQDSAGATGEAFATMDGGLSRSWDKIKTTALNALTKIGVKLAPFIETAVEWLAEKLPGAIDRTIKWFEDIGPTVGKVIKWFQENIPKAITFLLDVWRTIGPTVTTVFDTISSIIETFVGWFSSSEGQGQVGGTLETISGYFQGFLDFIGPIWDSIYEVVKVAMELISVVVELTVAGMQAFWENHGRAIFDFISVTFTAIGEVIQGVMSVIQGIIEVVLGIITGDWSRAWDGIVAIVDGIDQAIRGVVDYMMAQIGMLIRLGLDLIGNLFSLAWNAISTFVGNIWDTIVGTVTTKVESVRSTIAEKIGAARDFVTSTLETIRSLFSLRFSEAKADVTKLMGGIFTTITGVVAKIQTFIWTALGYVVTTFRTKFGEAVGAVGRALGRVKDAIFGVIGSAWGWAYDIGKAIVEGIVGGLWNIGSALGSKLRSGISSAVTSVKSFFGIRSPSTVMADKIGKPLALGITQPMDNLMKGLTGSLRSGSTVSPQFGTGLRPSPSTGPTTIVVNIGEEEVARVLVDRIRTDYIELDLDNDGWGVRT